MPKVEKYTEAARVRKTDFIVGMDKDGNVMKYPGLFFLRTVESDTNFLSLLQDEEEARIFNDGLLDARINTLEALMGLNMGNLELNLESFKVSIANDIFGPGGLEESLSSSISQTDSEIRLEVERLLFGLDGITESYNSAISQTAASITLSVENMLYGPGGVEAAYTSMIQQTATSITLSVDEKLYGPDGIEESYSSLIQQTSQSIILAVEQELYGPGGIQQQYSSAIQQYSDQIILTVNGTLNDFENQVYTEVGSIIQQSATDILLQVDGKIIDVKSEITTEYTSAITIAEGEINLSVAGQLTTLEGEITTAYQSAIVVAKDEIALTVSGQLTSLETDITTAYQSAIVVAKDEIALSVSGQLTTLEGDITTAYNTAITLSENQILSTVGTQITGLDGRITSNTSSITQLSNSIDLSVFTNGVLDAGILIGKINDDTSGVRITGKSITLDGNVQITGTAFAEYVYASGATIGGFTINGNSLQLGTQAAWNPSSGTEGLLMGIDPLDSKYKFYLGDVQNHLIWNGENLIISGFALIGDGSSTTTLNDLGKLEGYFEIVNEGQANEYLKLLAPLSVVGEVQAWAADPNIFPPNIWSSLPLASDTTLGAVRIGAGLTYNAVTGMIAVSGSVGTGFDQSANYSPSGTWNFTGSVSVGGSQVATQAYAQPVITGGASTITSSNLTASRALVSNTSGKVAVSAVTSTELGYLTGVTSAIQTQLNGKAASSHNQAISTITGLQTALDGKAALAGSSTQSFTVNNLIIHGTVNHWLADVITVDDARLQLNRTQGAATVASGLDIFNGTSVVSSFLYGTDGIWRAGGQRIYTDTYNPLADNATNLGGYSAASYPRKAEAAVITQRWTFSNSSFHQHIRLVRGSNAAAITITEAGWLALAGNDAPTQNNSVFIDSSGNFGICQINPTERLHVAGNGLFEGNLKTSSINIRNAGGLAVIENLGGGGTYLYAGSIGNNKELIIGSQGTSNVGFFTTIPQEKFHVNSNVLISGTSTLTGAVVAGGNVTAQGEVTAYSSSDIRLKREVLPITNALQIIEQINPVTYKWNEKAISLNSAKDDRVNYGVIAQELEGLLPELIHETNGYKSVDYPQLFGIMLAAIKELKQEINELKN